MTKIKEHIPGWLLETAIIFFILALVFSCAFFVYAKKYEDRIYPGVFAGKHNLSGKTNNEAKDLLYRETDRMSQNGIGFKYKNNQAIIFPVVSSAGGDIAYKIISFDADQAADAAIGFGRADNFLLNTYDKISALLFKRHITLPVTYNQQAVEKILEENFSAFNVPAQNAELKIEENGEKVTITEEKTGKVIDYKEAIKILIKNISNFDGEPITLSTITDYPTIYKKDCLNIENKTKDILAAAPLTLVQGENKWTIDKKQLADWLALYKNEGKIIEVGLDKEKTFSYLENSISKMIDIKPIDAKFTVTDGQVTEFQASRNGIELDKEASYLKLNEAIKKKEKEIALIVKITESSINSEQVNNFGIKEKLGTGESSFAGSPSNRRRNIKTGANSISGLLIKPGEEFSLIKALGTIDATTGYLPELVIKENKTIPEFGGGLCQVGTTLFRSVVDSGLPVTMRTNHSYRVSYYEPAGTDATIYDPSPDFRFKNDTNNHILIQSRIVGDKLYFDLWGTKDGRIAEHTYPVIYNIVKPEPTKIVETTELKPGEKKCTEKAHNGADAYFFYKVIYPDGTTKEKKFTSHYVPWREVCLIGVEKKSVDNSTDQTTASTTPNAVTQ